MASSAHDIEEGLAFKPKFDADELITAVVTDAKSGDVLMVAHMNDEALRKTIAEGRGLVLSAARARRSGRRARPPGTSSASSNCESIAIRTQYG